MVRRQTAVIAGFSCSLFDPSQHAVPSTPAEVWAASVACFPHTARLPHWSARSSSASTFSRPHRAFTCVTACCFAESPSDPFHRRLRQLRFLCCRFDCYWAKRPFPGGTCTRRIEQISRRTDQTSPAGCQTRKEFRVPKSIVDKRLEKVGWSAAAETGRRVLTGRAVS